MAGYNLKVITPDKIFIDQEVEKIIVRTTEGDVGILRNHVNYFAGIRDGFVKIFLTDGRQESADIRDGFVSVIDGEVVIMVLSYDIKTV